MPLKISRRNVLTGISGAVGLAAASSPSAAQQYHIGDSAFKLGIASYSFRKFSRAKAIQMAKELGTPYLNVKDFHLALDSSAAEVDTARREFADAGIIIVGCGNISFPKSDDADIRHKFEYAKALGAPAIVCAPTHETLPKLGKYVEEYNIKIAVHNHGPEDKQFPTPQSVLEVVRDMDPRCGLCIDVGHTSRTGVNIVQSIAQAGTRLLDMHIKDLADPMAKDSQVPVGDGKLPIPEIFLQLIKMKYKYCVNLEYEAQPENPLPGMEKSFSYMRGVLAGIQASKYSA